MAGSINKHADLLTRYADQIMLAGVLLSLNLIPPFLTSSEEAARILYLTSWAALGSAISASLFGAPLLAHYGANGPALARRALGYHLALLSCVLLAGAAMVAATSEQPARTLAFLVFVAAWATIDLLRRIYLAAQRPRAALRLSFVTLTGAATGLAFLLLERDATALWAGAALLTTLAATAGCLHVLTRLHAPEQARAQPAGRSVFRKDGPHALLSFSLAWGATQGVFIVFYQWIPATAFIEQKTLFSLLGAFSLLLTVQENRLQPLYSDAIHRRAPDLLRGLDRRVSRENLYIALVALVAVLIWWAINPGLSVFAMVLLFAYRHIHAVSRKAVYLLRSLGHFNVVMRANLAAFVTCYLTTFLAVSRTEYAIAVGFCVFALTFYAIVLIIARTEGEKLVRRWSA